MNTDTRHELESLLQRLIDGELDGPATERLESLLNGDVEACELYLDHITLHGHLHRTFGGAAPASRPPVMAPGLRPPTTSRWRWRSFALLAAALVIAFVAAIWMRSMRGPGDAIAVVVDAAPGINFHAGQRLGPGPVQLSSGSLRLRFGSDTVVTLTGPAAAYVESDMLVRLDAGRVAVRAGSNAVGFTIRTAASDFVDLGTEFGVLVEESGAAQIHVFDGAVIAKPSGSDLVIPVLRDEAGRVEPERGDLVAIDNDPAMFKGMSPLAGPASTAALYPRLPAGARVVFLGDRATDHETHLLLISQSFENLGIKDAPRLFNAGIALPLSFREKDYQRQVAVLRPTHAVLEFGPEIALDLKGRSVEAFERDMRRLLDRLSQDGVEAILVTGYPLDASLPAGARNRLAGYNDVVRRLAAARGLRLVDVEHRFGVAESYSPPLVADNGRIATFWGFREMAYALMEGFGYPNAPIDRTLRVSMLPGVLPRWSCRLVPQGTALSAEEAATLRPDASWFTLDLPQMEDRFLSRIGDITHSIGSRDRARGFASTHRFQPGTVVQAFATLNSPTRRSAWINTGASVHAVWLNGRKVLHSTTWRGMHAGKDRIPVTLEAGENIIVVETGHSFFISVTDTPDWPLR